VSSAGSVSSEEYEDTRMTDHAGNLFKRQFKAEHTVTDHPTYRENEKSKSRLVGETRKKWTDPNWLS